MKLVLSLTFLLALSPFASHAQYGVGGQESLQQHIANGNAEAERQAAYRNSKSAAPGGNYSSSGRPMPIFPFLRNSEEKQRRAANKAYHADKRRKRDQNKIDQELQRQRDAVRQ